MAATNQSEKAYQYIKQQLMARNIEAGSRLAEQAWAEKLSVNRSDIRQALARLLAEGAVVRGSGGGYFAREYTEQDVREINEVRFILESAVIRLAVQRATPQDLDELDEICRHMRIMAENGYDMGVGEADVRFHRRLVETVRNGNLSHIYAHANIPLSSTVIRSPQEMRERLLKGVQEHEQIVEALRQGDADKAVRLLAASLDRPV